MIDRPIFIVGSARSGTTILEEILGSHPDVCSPTLNLSRMLYKKDKLRMVYRFHKHFHKNDNTPTEAGNDIWKAFPKTKYNTIVTPKEKRKVIKTIETMLWLTKKNRFLDKNPEFSMMVPVIKEIFPNAKIIHITRDVLPVVSSLLEKEHSSDPTSMNLHLQQILGKDLVEGKDNAINLALAHHKYVKLAREFKDLDYLEITYNELVNKKETILKVIRFCDLKEIEFDYPDIIKGNDDKWKQKLTKQQIKEINKIDDN